MQLILFYGLGIYHMGGYGRIGVYREIVDATLLLIYDQKLLPIVKYADSLLLCASRKETHSTNAEERTTSMISILTMQESLKLRSLIHDRGEPDRLEIRREMQLMNLMYKYLKHAEWLRKGVYPLSNGSLAMVDIDALKGFVDLWEHLDLAIFANFDVKKQMKWLSTKI